ncbi:MAG TPA: hypothetical protein EYN70_14625 [Planctomycetaceae bacterium]|nr:hypothetical protein [Planctomycetaceae bacterium]
MKKSMNGVLRFAFVITAAMITLGWQGAHAGANKPSALLEADLRGDALKRCRGLIHEHVGRWVHSPTKREGWASVKMVMTWESHKKDFRTAVCTYEMTKGVTSLVIDDETVMKRQE